MTYSQNEPQPPDIPADSQSTFLTNFDLLNQYYGVNHIPFGNKIEDATLANPCVITSNNHRLETGDTIDVFHMYGINDELFRSEWSINGSGNNYSVTVIDENSFSIPVDTSSFDEYQANSGNFLAISGNLSNWYGYHEKINFNNNSILPNRAAPVSTLLTQEKEDLIQVFGQANKLVKSNALFFQNNIANEYRLTGSNTGDIIQSGVNTGKGFKTPWNVIINFWMWASFPNGTSTKIFTLPVPYTTTHYFTVATPLGKTNNSVRITSTSLTTFTATSSSSSGSRVFSFFSMGR